MEARTRRAVSDAPLSPSRLRLLRTCPRGFEQRYVLGRKEPASLPAEGGTGAHLALEHLVRCRLERNTLSDEDVAQALAIACAELVPEAAADVRQIVRRAWTNGWLPDFPSDAEGVGLELAVALDRDGQPVDWDAPEALWRGRLDLCWRENRGTLAVCDDWKTSRKVGSPDDDEQARQYAWALSCLWPDVTEVIVRMRYVRYGAVKEHVFEPEDVAELRRSMPLELEASRAAIARRAGKGDWRPRVSTSCVHCGYWADCPAMQVKPAPVVILETPEDAEFHADRLIALRTALGAETKALAAFTKEHGGIEVEGELVGYHASERLKVDAGQLAAFLAEEHGLDAGQVWELVSLDSRKLGRLLTAALEAAEVPRKNRRAERERLMGQLEAEGIVRREVTTRFDRKKAGENEDEEGGDDAAA